MGACSCFYVLSQLQISPWCKNTRSEKALGSELVKARVAGQSQADACPVCKFASPQRDLPPLICSVNRDCSLLPAQHSDTSGDPHSGFQLSLAGTFQYLYCSYWHRQQPGSEWKNYRSSSFSPKRMLGSWGTQLGRKREMGLLRNVRGSGTLPQL